MIKLRILAAILFGLSVTSTHAALPQVQSQADCTALAAAIKSNSFEKTPANQKAIGTLAGQYASGKPFSGKGGAYVAPILNSQKVLKIFPSIATASNKYNYRELFYTCINGFITYAQLGINIDGNPNLTAFPRVYEVGVTNAPEPGKPASQMVYPYMVFEFIGGGPLTKHGLDAKNNKEVTTYTQNSSYTLFAAGQKQATQNNLAAFNKRKTQALIYEMALILYKLNTMTINGKVYGFVHNDLNPGNVYLRNKLMSGTLDAGNAPVGVKDVPLLTLIDFGHSSSNFDADLGLNFTSTLKATVRTAGYYKSGSLADFYSNLNGRAMDMGSFEKLFSAYDADMRLFRQLVRALMDSGNYASEEFKTRISSCSNRLDCVKTAALVWPMVSQEMSAPKAPTTGSPRPQPIKMTPEQSKKNLQQQSTPPRKPLPVPPK